MAHEKYAGLLEKSGLLAKSNQQSNSIIVTPSRKQSSLHKLRENRKEKVLTSPKNRTVIAERRPGEFPYLPREKEGKNTIVPIFTMFPLKGDRAIVSRKMLAELGNYLRGYNHFLHQSNGKPRFIIKHQGNNEKLIPEGLKRIRRMIKKNPLFLGFVGTEMMLSLKEDIRRNDLTILFPLEGLDSMRKHNLRNIIYFRPPYSAELRALADFAIKQRHKTQVAILYEASKWGQRMLETCLEELEPYQDDITILTQASYPQGTVEIEKALDQIAKKPPSLVFCLARPRAAYTFIRSALSKGLHDTMFVGASALETVQKVLKTAWGANLVTTSLVPRIQDNLNLAIVREYKRVMKSFLSYHADSPLYFEMFITMSLFEAALYRIQGDLSLEKIIRSLEGFKQMNFKGLTIDFDPETRSLSSAVWINPGYGMKWEKFT